MQHVTYQVVLHIPLCHACCREKSLDTWKNCKSTNVWYCLIHFSLSSLFFLLNFLSLFVLDVFRLFVHIATEVVGTLLLRRLLILCKESSLVGRALNNPPPPGLPTSSKQQRVWCVRKKFLR